MSSKDAEALNGFRVRGGGWHLAIRVVPCLALGSPLVQGPVDYFVVPVQVVVRLFVHLGAVVVLMLVRLVLPQVLRPVLGRGLLRLAVYGVLGELPVTVAGLHV